MKTKFKITVGFLMLVLLSWNASAYSGGGGTCDCGNGNTILGGSATDACDDCEAALNDSANCANQVNYVGTVAISDYSGTCINNPANFTNKTFDCQRHIIDGDDPGSGWSTTYGIYLNGKSGNTIKNCVVTGFWQGIYLSGSSNNNLINNTANSNYQSGIFLSYSSNNTLTKNTINVNVYSGIYLGSSSNYNTITNNTVSLNTYKGIWLRYSLNNNISKNNISKNNYGIFSEKSSFVIENNVITSNDIGIKTNDNVPPDTMLFHYHPNSSCSKLLEPHVKELEQEGYNFQWILGGGSVPSLVCTINSKTCVGYPNCVSRIRNLAEECRNNAMLSINSNFVCGNINSDFDFPNYPTSSGTNNTCNTGNWNDNGHTGCNWLCNGSDGIENITNCTCDSCQDCKDKLNNPLCSVVTLNTNIINNSGSCIKNPVDFKNKVFDCQGHKIDGCGSSYGIYLYNKGGNNIRNCIITDFEYGIYLKYSSNNILTNNTAKDDGTGIYLDGCTYFFGELSPRCSSNNTLTDNIVCSNINTDINDKSLGNSGGGNTCNTTNNWNDDGIENACTFRCDGTACDFDNDYYTRTICGGSDCNDNNISINPNVTEVYCNGIDENCNGFDDCDCFDNDHDGYNGTTTECPIGRDCDDDNASIIPAFDNLNANQSLTICTNFYNINDTGSNGVIIINSSNVVLDCNNASLNGNGIGYGIYNPGFDNVVIKNCKIANYNYGVHIANSDLNEISDNEISDNNIGIYSQNSNLTINSNRVCGSTNLDFSSSNWLSSCGADNTCDNPDGWNDDGIYSCWYTCSGLPRICDLNYDGIIIHDYNDLMTAYKCFLGIKNCDNYHQNWDLIKQEYQCFIKKDI